MQFIKHHFQRSVPCHRPFWGILSRSCPTSSVSPHEDDIKYLKRAENKMLAYKSIQGKDPTLPGIIFCAGFQSNMHGVKATSLDGYCRQNNLSYVRFDYTGIGHSGGDIRESTITDWRSDILAVLDELTAGPQILVGSSLGGLMMLHTYLQRPHRVKALIGIASTADFSEQLFSDSPVKILDTVEREGEIHYETEDHHSYIITKKFVLDAKKHSILNMDTIPINCPVRLLHGLRDNTVPFQVSLELAKKLQSLNVNLLFRKNGDHRFSQPEDITLLFEVLNCMVHGTEEVRDMALSSWNAFSVYSHPKEQDIRN